MASFKKSGTLAEFQAYISKVYSLPDDRLYSLWDLLTQQQRFTMRALKGIRKENLEKVRINLLITLSWLMSICNRLHIEIEDEVWRRFPGICSYCGKGPCQCKALKPAQRLKIRIDNTKRPYNLSAFQKMFNLIYPESSRTLADAGVHLAEEMGEVSEAIHNFMGQHHQKQFEEVKLEIADFVSCVMGVANSAKFDMGTELSKMFNNNCHVCHKLPCVCKFTEVVQIRT